MKQKKRILVVEDDVALATALLDNLLSEGYEAAEVMSSCICGLEVRDRHIRNGRKSDGRR